MSRFLRACVASACPYAPRICGISGPVSAETQVSGTADLQFRTIAGMTASSRHGRQSTANAVGLHGPPGFKSPILRHLSSCCVRVLGLSALLLLASPSPCVAYRRRRPGPARPGQGKAEPCSAPRSS